MQIIEISKEMLSKHKRLRKVKYQWGFRSYPTYESMINESSSFGAITCKKDDVFVVLEVKKLSYKNYELLAVRLLRENSIIWISTDMLELKFFEHFTEDVKYV